MAKHLIQGTFGIDTEVAKESISALTKHVEAHAAAIKKAGGDIKSWPAGASGWGAAVGGEARKASEGLKEVHEHSRRAASGLGELFRLEPLGIRRGAHALGEFAGSLIDVGEGAQTATGAVGALGRSLSLGIGAGIAFTVIEKLVGAVDDAQQASLALDNTLHEMGIHSQANPLFRSAESFKTDLQSAGAQVETLKGQLRSWQANPFKAVVDAALENKFPGQLRQERQGQLAEFSKDADKAAEGMAKKTRETLAAEEARYRISQEQAQVLEEERRAKEESQQISAEITAAGGKDTTALKAADELSKARLTRTHEEAAARNELAASSQKIAEIQANDILPAHQKTLKVLQEEAAEAERQLRASKNLSIEEQQRAQRQATQTRARAKAAEKEEFFKTPQERQAEGAEEVHNLAQERLFQRAGGKAPAYPGQQPRFDASGNLIPPTPLGEQGLYAPYGRNVQALSAEETQAGKPATYKSELGELKKHMAAPTHMQPFAGSEEFKARFGEPQDRQATLAQERQQAREEMGPSREEELAANKPPETPPPLAPVLEKAPSETKAEQFSGDPTDAIQKFLGLPPKPKPQFVEPEAPPPTEEGMQPTEAPPEPLTIPEKYGEADRGPQVAGMPQATPEEAPKPEPEQMPAPPLRPTERDKLYGPYDQTPPPQTPGAGGGEEGKGQSETILQQILAEIKAVWK